LKNLKGFQRNERNLREPEILRGFPGGSLTEYIVSATSLWTDGRNMSRRTGRRERLDGTAEFFQIE
jgi:hypothetical protein